MASWRWLPEDRRYIVHRSALWLCGVALAWAFFFLGFAVGVLVVT